jgi:hypothetical protein
VTELSPEKRHEIADKLTGMTRPMLVGIFVLGVIAVLDLFTGFLLDDWRYDAVILAGCVLGLWGFFELRWLAGRVRTNQVPRQLGVFRWFVIAAGTLLGFGLIAAEGYVIGGLWVAVVLFSAFVALNAFGVVRGIRQRRRSGP